MTPRLRAAIVAVAAALLCGWIGTNVSEAPPAGIDLAGRAVAGTWPHVALVFTASCWWQVLVSLGVCALVFAFFAPAWRPRVIFSIATTLVAWLASDQLKNVFGRTRPDYWILHHETSKSYPSGHAMFAIVVYGLWSYYLATSPLPRVWRLTLSACAALWACGVIWSRLALGAHFVTDLAGGILFGITMLSIAIAVTAGIPPLSSQARPLSSRAKSRDSHQLR
jgi:membrane-associated phospholipid phosphatase